MPVHRLRALPLCAALLAVGCGDDDAGSSNGTAAPPGLATVAVADAPAHDGDVVVLEGLFLAAPEAVHRLCAGLAESYPPQCAGASVELVGLERDQVTGTSTNEELPEGERTLWTDRPIRLTGTLDGDRFVLVRTAEDVGDGFVVVHARAGDAPVVGAPVELWGEDETVGSARTDDVGIAVFDAPAGAAQVVPLPVSGFTAPERVPAEAGDTVLLEYAT